jgi:hypothetical protein
LASWHWVQFIISAARIFKISAGFPRDFRIISAEYPRRGYLKYPQHIRNISATYPRRGYFKYPQVIPKRK